MNKEQLQWFEDLTQIDGVSGHEHDVAAYMDKAFRAMGADEIIHDQLGSLLAYKKSSNPDAKKVMILGHMDEVGFLVKQIMPSGALKLHPVGGWFSQNLLAHRFTLTTRDGKKLPGTIGSIPPHLLPEDKRNAPIQIADMLGDIGALDADDAKAMGVNVGDMIVIQGGFEVLNGGKRLLAKAFDNRYGCVMALDLFNSFKDQDLDYDLYVGASVQEEVGLRGAQTITQKVDPDFAIILDCSPANDIADAKALGVLGQGVLIRMADGSMIAQKSIINQFVDVCVKHDIKHQYYYSPGGTDAGIVHKSNHGVPTLTCCLVARNIHTSSSILDTEDYDGAKVAITEFLGERPWDK